MRWLLRLVIALLISVSAGPLVQAADSGDSEDAALDVGAEIAADSGATASAESTLSASQPEGPDSFDDPSAPPGFERPEVDDPDEVEPWDFSPYRVLVWLVSDDPTINVGSLEKPVRDYLDRDYSAIWRIHFAEAPPAVRSASMRDMSGLSYDVITAADPVLAIKKGHKEAVRIRTPKTVGEFVTKIYGTQGRIDEVKRRGAALGDETVEGVAQRLEAVDGDALAVRDLWAQESTEGVLVSRGMATTLDEPEAKLITPRLSGMVGKAVEVFDKIFVVRVRSAEIPNTIEVLEIDTLMRHFGPVARLQVPNTKAFPDAIGRGLTSAFAPVVRIENAGQKNAVGLLRARGLIMNEDSPAAIHVGDVLEPMTRKNDRNGKPILIGPIDWAFLLVTEPEIAVLGAGEGTGFKVGDRVTAVSQISIENPQQVERILREKTGGTITVGVSRNGGDQTVTADLADSSKPLRPMYLGFTAGERRGTVIVDRVLRDAPADGKLQSKDVIVSVNGAELSGMSSLRRLVASTKADQPVKLSILRGEDSSEVTLVPTDQSLRERNNERLINMDYFSGRAGGLQGRKNKRTFRTALKVRAFRDSSLLRLHLQRNPNFPLIGYELYQKELQSSKMTFIGRTDWNGRLKIERTGDPLRLLYVKNGGAVLARLPLVPGLHEMDVADLSGDDMRLQAEAYIRGVQNAIIDLVALRELFKARIRLRLQKGEMEKAEVLMTALRDQPSNEKLAADMGKKQAAYLKALGTRNANQRRKVDEMFTTTRELLSKHINPKLVRDLESLMIKARNNGGKLPPESPKVEEE